MTAAKARKPAKRLPAAKIKKPVKAKKPAKVAKRGKPAKAKKPIKTAKPIKTIVKTAKLKTILKTIAKTPATPKVKAAPPATRANLAKPVTVVAAKPEKVWPPTLLGAILHHLNDAKAEDVIAINLDGKAAIADNMVVASGRSDRHVGAIADQLVEKLKAAGYKHLRVEGMPQCDWVLVDTGDVIVHLFRPEVRSFYNLEKLWSEHSPQEQVAI